MPPNFARALILIFSLLAVMPTAAAEDRVYIVLSDSHKWNTVQAQDFQSALKTQLESLPELRQFTFIGCPPSLRGPLLKEVQTARKREFTDMQPTKPPLSIPAEAILYADLVVGVREIPALESLQGEYSLHLHVYRVQPFQTVGEISPPKGRTRPFFSSTPQEQIINRALRDAQKGFHNHLTEVATRLLTWGGATIEPPLASEYAVIDVSRRVEVFRDERWHLVFPAWWTDPEHYRLLPDDILRIPPLDFIRVSAIDDSGEWLLGSGERPVDQLVNRARLSRENQRPFPDPLPIGGSQRLPSFDVNREVRQQLNRLAIQDESLSVAQIQDLKKAAARVPRIAETRFYTLYPAIWRQARILFELLWLHIGREMIDENKNLTQSPQDTYQNRQGNEIHLATLYVAMLHHVAGLNASVEQGRSGRVLVIIDTQSEDAHQFSADPYAIHIDPDGHVLIPILISRTHRKWHQAHYGGAISAQRN